MEEKNTPIYVISIESKLKGSDRVILINNSKSFKKYAFYKILDEENSNPICKISTTYSCRKLRDIDNVAIFKAAESCNFSPDGVFYYADVEIEKELITSISPTAVAIPATEDEMYDYLYTNSDDNLILGEIRGTEENYSKLTQNKYKNVLYMSKDWKLTAQANLPILFDYKKMQQNPNIGIFGNSGSGKSFTLKTFVEELIIHGIPGILFDPHNEFDFSDFIDGLPNEYKYDFASNVKVFEAGKDFGLRFTDLSNENFKAFMRNVSTLSEPQELAIDEIRVSQAESFETFVNNVEKLASALQKRDAKNGGKVTYTPDEQTLIDRFGNRISSASVVTALNAKLHAFSKRGYFRKDFDCIINAIKNKNVVIVRGEYDMVAPIMAYIIGALWKKRKDFKDGISPEEFPPMVTIIDEAHIYCPKFSNENKTPLKKPLSDIAREGRKYGMFLIIATQRVSELDTTILSQMSTKVILRITQESDKKIIETECGLSEAELNRLHLLETGTGYIVSPILKTKSAMSIKFRSNYTKPKTVINVFDELKTLKAADTKDTFRDFLISALPFKSADFNTLSSNYSSISGTLKSTKEIKAELKKLVDEGIISEVGFGFSVEYSIKNKEVSDANLDDFAEEMDFN